MFVLLSPLLNQTTPIKSNKPYSIKQALLSVDYILTGVGSFSVLQCGEKLYFRLKVICQQSISFVLFFLFLLFTSLQMSTRFRQCYM